MIKYIEHRLKKSFCANCVQGQEAELIGKRQQLSEKDRIIDSIKETKEFKATDIKGIRDKSFATMAHLLYKLLIGLNLNVLSNKGNLKNKI